MLLTRDTCYIDANLQMGYDFLSSRRIFSLLDFTATRIFILFVHPRSSRLLLLHVAYACTYTWCNMHKYIRTTEKEKRETIKMQNLHRHLGVVARRWLILYFLKIIYDIYIDFPSEAICKNIKLCQRVTDDTEAYASLFFIRLRASSRGMKVLSVRAALYLAIYYERIKLISILDVFILSSLLYTDSQVWGYREKKKIYINMGDELN